MSLLGSLAIAGGISALNGLMSYASSAASTGLSVDAQKELFDYQWDKAQSPKAQIRNLTAEGVNPTALFGNSPNVVGGSMPSANVPPVLFSTGVDNVRDFTGALSDLANAKKTGVDTKKAEKEVEGQQLSNDAQELQNKITREYGMKRAGLDLATAYEGVLLSEKENDLKLKEKALKDWEIAKEKALSEASEVNRDILRKELANKDKEIELRNKESEARAESSRASAEASRASAEYSRALTLTEDVLRDIRVTSGRLENSFKDNEINYNVATFQTRVDALKNQLTSYEMDTILKKIEAQDKSAYTTLQRLFYGKGSVNGADAKRALHLFNEVVSSPLGN